MKLSVVIPAYNEEKRIGGTFRAVREYLGRHYGDFEIIIVDDGSSDNTAAIAEGIAKDDTDARVIRVNSNMGKGAAVKTGVLASKGDLILFSDADMSTHISEADKLKACIHAGCDIAIGSRAMKGSEISRRQNIIREYMGRIFNWVVRLMVINGIYDTQCGFKMFTRKAAMDIFGRQKIKGFSFDVEVLYLAKRLGYEIKSVPVKWANSPDSKVAILGSSAEMLLGLFGIRRSHKDL